MSELESNSNQNQPNKKSPGKNRYISDLENAAKAHKVKANSSFPLPVFGAALAFLILGPKALQCTASPRGHSHVTSKRAGRAQPRRLACES